MDTILELADRIVALFQASKAEDWEKRRVLQIVEDLLRDRAKNQRQAEYLQEQRDSVHSRHEDQAAGEIEAMRKRERP